MVPELPEVELVRQGLLPTVGQEILGVELYWPALVLNMSGPQFVQGLTGQTIRGVQRRGKYLLIQLSQGWIWVLHLRMTGQLFLTPGPVERSHLRLRLWLTQGVLDFRDVRKFGMAYLLPPGGEEPKGLAGLGPEPLGPGAMTLDQFWARCQRHRPLKALLLDQGVIAGVGNIYADEALFRAGLHPLRRGEEISRAQAARLLAAIRRVLKEGIAAGGSTIRDYRGTTGGMGRFQERFRVYGREGEACHRCGQAIQRIRVSGRSSHFCPHCQEE